MRKLNEEEGYTVTDICDAFEVSRNSYYYHKNKAEKADEEENDDNKFSEFNQQVLEKIKEVKKNHPYYGYRRVTARVNAKLDVRVNRKRVYRLMKEAEDDLLCENPNYDATRHDKDDRDKPQPDEPNERWGIDMTKHYIDGYGWQPVAVKDWYTKEILGRCIASDGKTERWKSALNEAVQYACPEGSREEEVNLMSDNGSQPTSYAFEELCDDLGINHVTTSYDNPKGNAETESWMRTLKEDCLWINDFDSPKEAKEKINSWIEYYNTEYPHSSIGMKSPREMREETELVEEVEKSINSGVQKMAAKSV